MSYFNFLPTPQTLFYYFLYLVGIQNNIFPIIFRQSRNSIRFKDRLLSEQFLKSSLNKIFLFRAIAIPNSIITPSSGGVPLTIAKIQSHFLKSWKLFSARSYAQLPSFCILCFVLSKGS